MEDTTSARIELNNYSNKVLAVIKAKYDLKDKSEAINKFAELYGDDFVEKDASEVYVKRVMAITNSHLKKHGSKKMTIKELDALCEV